MRDITAAATDCESNITKCNSLNPIRHKYVENVLISLSKVQCAAAMHGLNSIHFENYLAKSKRVGEKPDFCMTKMPNNILWWRVKA